MKNLYILLFFLITGFIAIILYTIILKLQKRKDFYPFAFLPEINISQQPTYASNYIISKRIPNLKIPDGDQNMVIGKYERYPLGRPKQNTSVVACSPNVENYPIYTAWNIEVDIFAWNFVWCDSGSSYFVTPISLESTPLVVLKGSFPFCRYFSIYTYAGIEFTDSGENLFGQGIAQDGYNVCNASMKEGNLKCQGLRDYEIYPDEGSKNPFTDPTYNDKLDDAFYTIYLKSPYYNGPMPNFKNINILPLSIYGTKTALIVYRIYSPFNPKSCNSNIYWKNVSFDSMGCKNTVKQLIVRQNGGSADPNKDKTSICDLGDKICYNKCIADKLGHTNEKDCHQYVGNNLYCVCKKPDSPCYNVLNKYINECTNGKGSIDNFCSRIPDKHVDICLDDVKCQEDDITCINYVKSSKVQQCTAEKLLNSENNDCYKYKNPNNICQICKGYKEFKIDDNGDYIFPDGSCQQEFQNYLKDCSQKYDYYTKDTMPLYCGFKCGDPPFPATMEPPLYYDPQYNFNTTPLSCNAERYDCINGNCFPSKDGPFTDPNCNNQCYYGCKISPSVNPVKSSIRRPIKEDYVPYSDKTRPCIIKYDEKDCDLNKKQYKDIGIFGINSVPPEKIFAQGWVDLPQCFVKYNYNNYFIKLNSWNLQKLWKLSLYKSLDPALKGISAKNPINPNKNMVESFQYNNITDAVNCVSNTISSNNYYADVNACFDDMKEEKGDDSIISPNPMCEKWVDKDNYFYVGAEFPYSKLPIPDNYGENPPDITCPQRSIGYDKTGSTRYKTFKSSPPYCNYYTDQCRCDNHQSNLNNCCEYSLGRLKCSGEPCFIKWSHNVENCKIPFVYDGEAQPFAASANTGNVIPFPNPDATYLGCCTNYDPDSVYVIWVDLPSFPHTPGFSSLIESSYDLRYFSFGHYCWNMTIQNPRPVLSDLVDYEIKSIPVEYKDEYINKTIQGNRACIVLATIEQYTYLQNYNLWDDKKLNWLNWGKVDFDLTLKNDVKHISPSVKPIQDIKIPKKGILLYRQLFPDVNFKEAIQYFNDTDCSKNVEKTVTTNFEYSNMFNPRQVPKYCNPGPGTVNAFDKLANEKDEKGNPYLGQDICKVYGLDPCCLSKNVLYFSKNYYPRCEKIKICDIEKTGVDYWDRYFKSLPYKFDENDIPPFVEK